MYKGLVSCAPTSGPRSSSQWPTVSRSSKVATCGGVCCKQPQISGFRKCLTSDGKNGLVGCRGYSDNAESCRDSAVAGALLASISFPPFPPRSFTPIPCHLPSHTHPTHLRNPDEKSLRWSTTFITLLCAPDPLNHPHPWKPCWLGILPC